MATTFEKGAKKREFLLSCQASDWDLRLLREHRETLALDSGFRARLVFLPLIIYYTSQAFWGCAAISRAPSDLPVIIYLSPSVAL